MKIAVLGYGTVGSGVVEIVKRNHDNIAKRAGEEIDVKYVLDLRDFEGDPVQEILVHEYSTIINDPEVGIIVEVMGGTDPSYSYVKEALLKGKSVCTSNKELVAKYGAELLEIARQKKVNFLFEASVGGGIPIIRPLNQSITADEIEEITGILNGTTNYILTEMRDKEADFEDALKDAQNKGFAERNPSADIDGFDACRKIAILTSLAYGMNAQFEDIYTEGIRNISLTDIKYAEKLGAAIKLFATSKKVDDKIYAYVAPRMIKPGHPLFSVNGVFNAILVRGNMLGDVMFYGSGAGKLPTASAVVSDVVDAVKHQGKNIMTIWSSKKLEFEDKKKLENKFFVRVSLEEKAQAAEIFNVNEFITLEGQDDEVAFITDKMSEEEFLVKSSKIHVKSRVRVEF